MSGTCESSAPLPRRRRLRFALGVLASVVVSLAVGAEVVLRLCGVDPWRMPSNTKSVEPGGSLFRPDPVLGYTHLPGAFVVTLATGYQFRMTHLPNTLRVTHPLETYPSSPEKEGIWIFGCSITHGWSLNDEETYPWLLQEHFPDFEIVNFGVSGYGTLHSLLQLREALQHSRPRLVVLAYASFHDVRNLDLRKRQKAALVMQRFGSVLQPYARLDEQGELRIEMATQEYGEFPLMRVSALSHFLEMTWNDIEASRSNSAEVARKLVLEIDRVAREHGTRLVVAFIDQKCDEMKRFTDEHGIPSFDISVDLSIRGNTNYPHNEHPSARANRHYANTLEPFLWGMLAATAVIARPEPRR